MRRKTRRGGTEETQKKRKKRSRNQNSTTPSQYAAIEGAILGDGDTVNDIVTCSNVLPVVLDKSRLLREEKRGQGDVDSRRNGGRRRKDGQKPSYPGTLLLCFEKRLHTTRVRHSCDTRRAVLRVACGVSLWKEESGRKGRWADEGHVPHAQNGSVECTRTQRRETSPGKIW